MEQMDLTQVRLIRVAAHARPVLHERAGVRFTGTPMPSTKVITSEGTLLNRWSFSRLTATTRVTMA